MGNELQVFRSAELGEIRTLEIDGEPWFVGRDVAGVLGYTNAPKSIKDHVDDEDKLIERIVMSGQNRDVIFINESGLYSLIFGSKQERAKKFKHWVTSEVLPAIRKSGGYVHSDEAFVESYLSGATEDVKALFKNNLEIMRRQNETIRKLEEVVANRSRTYDRNISIEEMCVLIGQYGYHTSPRGFRHWMKESGFLGKEKYRYDYNKPSERSTREGLLMLEYIKDGDNRRKTKLWLTPKFQKLVLEKHLKMALQHPQASFLQLR